MNNTRSTRSGRMRPRLIRLSGVAAAAAVIALGIPSCARNVEPAGPSGGHTASSSPSGKATTRTTPSSSPSVGRASSPAATAKLSSKVHPHGNIKQHAKTHKIRYRKHVPLTGSAKFENGVAVRVTSVRGVTSHAVGPGQVGGPALALTVKIKNGSKAALDLSTVTVALSGAKGVPGILATGSPYAPLDGSLPGGDSAKGTYVFTLAKAYRRPITVQVQYGNGQTVLQFSGNA